MVRVGLNVPLEANRTNGYGHVVMVHGYVLRTLCSVCATGVRFLQSFSWNQQRTFLIVFFDIGYEKSELRKKIAIFQFFHNGHIYTW